MGELEVAVAERIVRGGPARSGGALVDADAAMVLMSPPGCTIPACVVAVAWLPEPVNGPISQRPVQLP